jgi:hypothetical protein
LVDARAIGARNWTLEEDGLLFTIVDVDSALLDLSDHVENEVPFDADHSTTQARASIDK